MKVVACLDEYGSPAWIAFPTETSEISEAIRDLGYEPLDGDDVIEYEEGSVPDWHTVKPVWRCKPLATPTYSA